MVEQRLERLEGNRGLYGSVRTALGQLFASPRAEVLEPLAAEGETLLPRVRERIGELWAALAGFLANHQKEGDARQLVLSITSGSRAQPDWSQLEVAWENADLSLADLYRNLERVALGLSGLDETQVAGLDTLQMEVSTSTAAIGDFREKLKSFIAHPEDNRIYWMAQDNRAGEIALNAAPLEVGELLQEKLFSQKESVVPHQRDNERPGQLSPRHREAGPGGRGLASGGLAIRLPQGRAAVHTAGYAGPQQRRLQAGVGAGVDRHLPRRGEAARWACSRPTPRSRPRAQA